MSSLSSTAKREKYLSQLEILVKEWYEENYERLKFDGGRALTPKIQQQGLAQVVMYIKKLIHIAETVTDTEVKLILSNQESPNGNKYSIVGVIDIIRDHDKLTLYDIKTHDPDFINTNIDDFSEQLNIYAHVFQNIRNKKVNSAAIVATKLPQSLEKIASNYINNRVDDKENINEELDRWEPIIPVDNFTNKIETAINKFSKVVDNIERKEFKPPGIEKLKKRTGSSNRTFATNVCNNCDVRFTCNSYKKYSKENYSRKGNFQEYLNEIIGQENKAEALEDDIYLEEETIGDINEHLY